MEQSKSEKYREFEKCTTTFAIRVMRLCKALPKDTINNRLIDQVIRSSGSIGANYREANEALSRKDFVHRLRIARKEAKETEHWLEIIREANENISAKMSGLFDEVNEIRKILSSILIKTQNKV